MIKMPDFEKSYDYETFFHLTLNTSRLGKFIAHYEAYKMIRSVPGAIVECGVFKGTSFVRFAHFRSLLDNQESSKLIGLPSLSNAIISSLVSPFMVTALSCIALIALCKSAIMLISPCM